MSLFGADMPLAVQFFFAFIDRAGADRRRRLGWCGASVPARLGGAGARGRQPRLAVIDHASVDGRRRLILVRRDNVEHLLMIGGPTDVVVEANIVRAAPATARSAVAATARGASDPLPRAMPLPEPAANGSWPLQPEPAAPPRPADAAAEPSGRTGRVAAAAAGRNAAARSQRDTLPRSPTNSRLGPRAAAARPQSRRPQPPQPRPARAEPTQELRQDRGKSRAEPATEPRPEPVRSRASLPPRPPLGCRGAADRSLAEMAQRLEAALRKPTAKTERSEPARTAMPSAPAPAVAAASPANGSAPRTARPRRIETAGAPGRRSRRRAGKALYDSLEQEMASLFGRPTARPDAS